jgi:hypothetical protein
MPSTTVLADVIPASPQSTNQTTGREESIDALYRRLQVAGVEPIPPDARQAVAMHEFVTEENWDDLRGQVEAGAATLALAGFVVPQCPLLSAEPASVTETPLKLQVPEGSAWVCMRVDLSRFSNPDGTLDENALYRSLETCVDVGEALHDVVHWSTPQQSYDAWLNRRLAVMITGIGDLAASAGEEPGSHQSLRRLNQVLVGAHRTLQSRSRQIAMCSDRLPAITLSDPSHRLPSGSIRDDWRRRWQQAARVSLVRHRNLLVLSPWSLFPADRPADLRYAEFLPVLRHADTIAFDKNVSTSHWNLNEFKRFCQRSHAVLQQRIATCLIARHV